MSAFFHGWPRLYYLTYVDTCSFVCIYLIYWAIIVFNSRFSVRNVSECRITSRSPPEGSSWPRMKCLYVFCNSLPTVLFTGFFSQLLHRFDLQNHTEFIPLYSLSGFLYDVYFNRYLRFLSALRHPSLEMRRLHGV